MIKNQNINETELTSLTKILCQICNDLNNCLPETQQVQINTSLQSIAQGLQKIKQKIITTLHSYEKLMQNLQDNLRKHIKNQIQLKLYYQHLQDVIVNLKKQKLQTAETIQSLKTQLSVLKQKQKCFMTVSNNNTRNNQDFGHIQSKLDTITKIKHRLSLNATQQFYANYITKKMDKDHDTKQLRQKRESLANTLKQLYQSPIQRKGDRKQKSKSKDKQKNKDKDRDKDKSREHSKSRQSLSKNKSRKSLNSTDGFQRNSFKNCEKNEKNKNVKQKKEQKDYLKTSFNQISSRRNSKS